MPYPDVPPYSTPERAGSSVSQASTAEWNTPFFISSILMLLMTGPAPSSVRASASPPGVNTSASEVPSRPILSWTSTLTS